MVVLVMVILVMVVLALMVLLVMVILVMMVLVMVILVMVVLALMVLLAMMILVMVVLALMMILAMVVLVIAVGSGSMSVGYGLGTAVVRSVVTRALSLLSKMQRKIANNMWWAEECELNIARRKAPCFCRSQEKETIVILYSFYYCRTVRHQYLTLIVTVAVIAIGSRAKMYEHCMMIAASTDNNDKWEIYILLPAEWTERLGHFAVKKVGYGYLPHRWGILLFTPPPGSRARRLGWSQYMHKCVGASQGYHGVRVRVRVRVSWGGWLILGVLPRPVWGFRCTRGST